MKYWKVTINGTDYYSSRYGKDLPHVIASQMNVAVSRCLKSHYKLFPEQRLRNTIIHVKYISNVPKEKQITRKKECKLE